MADRMDLVFISNAICKKKDTRTGPVGRKGA
jgi:hypothetical protein